MKDLQWRLSGDWGNLEFIAVQPQARAAPQGSAPANVAVCSQVKMEFIKQNSPLFNTGVAYLFMSIMVLEAKGQIFRGPGPGQCVGGVMLW